MVLFDGLTALVLALAVGVGLHRWRAGEESPHDRSLQVQRVLSLPVALDILAACFAIGASQRDALDAVARSVGGTLEHDLAVVSGAMHVGADVREAWSLIDAPDLHALSAVLARADVTGAPVTPLLAVLADQHRQRARMVAMDAARALGVRVAGPLGLCFLPAFVAVAVIPLVISLLPLTW
jgi:pilus assembly protein TadC